MRSLHRRNGKEHVLEAARRLERHGNIARRGLPVAAMRGACACATCPVYIDGEWYAKLARFGGGVDMLDMALSRRADLAPLVQSSARPRSTASS